MTNADNAAGQPSGNPGYGEQNYPGYGQQDGWQQPQQPVYPQQPVDPQQPVYPQQGQGYLDYAQQNAYGYQGYGQHPAGSFPAQPMVTGPSEKAMLPAALLAFFLGAVGVHNFYLGQTKRGVVKVVMYPIAFVVFLFSFLSVVGANDLIEEGYRVSDTFYYFSQLTVIVTGLVCFGIQIWAFVEFILILMRNGRYGVDAQGRPLS